MKTSVVLLLWSLLLAFLPMVAESVAAATGAAGGPGVAAAAPDATAPDAAAQGAEPAMEAVLSRHIEWLGGRTALERVRSVSVAGTMEASGLSGSFEAAQERTGRQYLAYDLGAIKGSSAVGPDSAWVRDGSGRIEPMGTEEKQTALREVARSFSGHLLGTDGSSRRDLGTEEKDGRPWRVIGFAYPGGDTYDLFLDPGDGSFTWARETRDTEVIWHRYEEWRMVDGIRIAFRLSDLYANPTSNQVTRLDKVSINQELAPELFAVPDAGSSLHHIEGGAVSGDWTPMSLYRGAYIWVRGTVNGVDTDMLLDSGAGMTVLDKAFAASLGVATAGEVVAKGTVGESTASFATGLSVHVGGLDLRDLHAAVIDLSGVAARLGRPLPVILGKEVFHAVVVDVDYPAQRIRFIEPEGYRYDGPGRRLPVHPAGDGHAQVEISVEGLPPVRVGLDTGSGAALDLFGPYVEEYHLLEGRPRVSETLIGGVGGSTTAKLTTLRAVEIAGYTLTDVPVGIAQVDKGAFATKRAAGNLGAGILKRFRVVFDYEHDCLWMEPGPETASAPFRRNNSGLSLDRRNGALEVLLVAGGSPAAREGWKAGERIVTVDGAPVGEHFSEEIDLFTNRPEGTVVRLGLEDGSDRKLTLARYY